MLNDTQIALNDMQIALNDIQIALSDIQIALNDSAAALSKHHPALNDNQLPAQTYAPGLTKTQPALLPFKLHHSNKEQRMPTVSRTTIAGQLNAARVAIHNTKANGELHTLVAAYGYGEDKLQEGQRLYDLAIASVNAAVGTAGMQRQATMQARAAEQQARANYQALAQVARALFGRDTPQRTALGLVGKAPQDTPAFLAAATTLFENAMTMSEITQVLTTYGYDARRVAMERSALATFEQANQAQVAAISAAQQASRSQRAALAALNQWVAQYLKIAKIALRGKPELIESLGGVARTTRTAAQREAPKKAAATRAAKQAA